MKKLVVCTGGFDPIHSGHIEYLKSAKALGDYLIVGLNSDEWLTKKKGRYFMPWNERAAVLKELKCVDEVVSFADSDNSARQLLIDLKNEREKQIDIDTGVEYYDIIFTNGGDRTKDNIPEMDVPGVEFVFGVGGDFKRNSSSWILQEWKAPKTEREWGYYRVLHDVPGLKVKELTVDPGKNLSMQRHFKRSEYWFVAEGIAINMNDALGKYDSTTIPVNTWHQLANPTTALPLKIIEIQYGRECVEDDIERK